MPELGATSTDQQPCIRDRAFLGGILSSKLRSARAGGSAAAVVPGIPNAASGIAGIGFAIAVVSIQLLHFALSQIPPQFMFLLHPGRVAGLIAL